MPAIQLDGCTVSQNAVAKLMARLRGVQGVSRVSLQSSVKPAKADATVADSASTEPVTGCDVTDGKTPPDFTVIAFFEGEAAAAAAPSTTTPAPADATATPAAGTESSTSVPTAATSTETVK